ncbi:MAG: hypothetical protein HOW73_18425 [Polyangiaceae bacterium]|nr:hypothetical protein [Polyangiaceae bacterium]
MRKHGLLVTFGIVAAGLGCGPRGGTDVGNGVTATFDVSAYKGAGTDEVSTLSSGARVDAFWISVAGFRLLPGAGCTGSSGEGQLTLDGPIVANLAEQDAAPGSSDDVAVDGGEYCRLRASLEQASASDLPPGAPASLEGASLYLEGVRADGTPFRLRSKRKVSLQLDAPEGTSFELAGDSHLVVAFDLEEAVASLDLDTLDGDDEIVIDETIEPQRLTAFEGSLRTAARLFRDEDDDGILSEAEASPGKALARGEL